MKNTATDPYSAGRNFADHYSVREWNVVPVSSPIEVQFSMAPGTALRATSAPAGKGITIVQGGDAGTAEGDFATCLVWSSRPGDELPLLMIVTNNQWGISTPRGRAARREAHRRSRQGASASRPRSSTATIPRRATASSRRRWTTCAPSGKPFLLEAMVSRLYGHSSASGRELRHGRGRLPRALREEARGAADPDARARWTSCARSTRSELARGEQARARGAAARRREHDLGSTCSPSDELRRRRRSENGVTEWRRWSRRSAWRSTSARSASA